MPTLRERIERLEAGGPIDDAGRPPIVIRVADGRAGGCVRPDTLVIAASTAGTTTTRLPGEPIAVLAARAAEARGKRPGRACVLLRYLA